MVVLLYLYYSTHLCSCQAFVFNGCFLFIFLPLRSVVEDLVVIVVNKVGGLDEGISVGGQFFEDDGQRFGCVVGIVVEQHDTARLDPPRDPCNDAVDRGRVLPIKAVTIRYKSKEFSF